MNKAMDIANIEKVERYKEMQYHNLHKISKLFEKYLYRINQDVWEDIIQELDDVLCKCDKIDYQSNATAIAYAIFHFLDRYHRIQLMCQVLLENGYINRAKQYDILDVGTGPSQVLFALSDHFQSINLIEGKELCTVRPDYVEQSYGFREFLHQFVELALSEGVQYRVPFHHGRTQNISDIIFNELQPAYGGLSHSSRSNRRYTKYRYDISVFNNFFTKIDTVKSYADVLQNICTYTRNHGLVIIIGASEKNKKYSKVYPMIDEIILSPISDKNFHNHWDKVLDREFTYKYNDDCGKIICDYFRVLARYLQDNNLWEGVPPMAKKEIEHNLNIWKQENDADLLEEVTWKMVVYRKTSKPKFKVRNKTHSYIHHKSVDKI